MGAVSPGSRTSSSNVESSAYPTETRSDQEHYTLRYTGDYVDTNTSSTIQNTCLWTSKQKTMDDIKK